MVQRVYWSAPFRNSDQLYMLDGAVVTYAPDRPGVRYEHQLIRDNMCIFEKPQAQFYGLPVGEEVELVLDSEDDGLFAFPEVRFFKRNALIACFLERDSKTVHFTVPDYDDFTVRTRVRGRGSTRLLSVTARVVSLEGLLFVGDQALSEQIGVETVDGDSESLLVSFSQELRYLTAEFFTDTKPQVHFASLNGQFDLTVVRDYLQAQPYRRLRLYQPPSELLQKLTDYDKIDLIE